VPLSKIQSDILRLLSSRRDPESYVAGSTPLNRDTARFSTDIDIFHDRRERVAVAAAEDAEVLEGNGYTLVWSRQEPSIQSVTVSRDDLSTKLEWVADSDFRFFPTMMDPTFGYILHPADMAMNKAHAAVGRRELRDLVDLVSIHETILALGATVWAAVEKMPGFSPEAMIAEIRRNSLYPKSEWRALVTVEPFDPAIVYPKLRAALDEAEAFVNRMPTDLAGLLFLKDGKVVQPDPGHLDQYQTHAGQRRGHWPSSPEIETAMLAAYKPNPKP
jgi:hypothetical protein